MKKFTFLVCAVFACIMQINAQEPQIVSKEQQNRNVIIEEFTGRNCPNCPDGHRYANEIVHEYPGRVWAVNVHAGAYAPTTYPNLITTDGTQIDRYSGVQGYPMGAVNRVKTAGRNEWSGLSKQQLQEIAEVNLDGMVVINPATREAKITVEAYYTKDSKADNNYLTIMMLQDSILGSQSGANYNPAQIIDGQYCHMHVLRDVITETFGDEIAPTTAGSLVTKQYVYNIPEVIGSPNGVEVDLDNISFVAFVTEKVNGTRTTPVLNVCELQKLEGTDEPIYPFIKSVEQENLITCTNEKKFFVSVSNGGTDVITSMKFEIAVNGGEKTEQEWTGNLPVYGNTRIEMFAEVPFGGALVNFKIVEANGEAYSFEKSIMGVSEEWIQVELGDTDPSEEFKLELAQDRFGNQTKWQVVDHNDKVIANGGPYEMLPTAGTKVHELTFTIPAGECAMFIIEDNVGNGITSESFGKGYYKLYDSKGNILAESDGDFGFGEYHIIYVHGAMSVEDVTETTYNIFPNPVKDVLTITGENMSQITVFNALGQLVKSVNCNDYAVQINVNDLQNGMYFVNVIDNQGNVATSKVSVLR